MKTKHKTYGHYANLIYAELGIRPVMISVTGSTAWGTDVEGSDVDLTVVGIDRKPDIYNYPRKSFTDKIFLDDGDSIDVRFWSVSAFLGQVVKSPIVAYEAVYGLPLIKNHAWEIIEGCMRHYRDDVSIFRSAFGALLCVQKEGFNPTTRRQAFRYLLVLLQIAENVENTLRSGVSIESPVILNAQEYFEQTSKQVPLSFTDVAEPYVQLRWLFRWAFSELPENDDETVGLIIERLRAIGNIDRRNADRNKPGYDEKAKLAFQELVKFGLA